MFSRCSLWLCRRNPHLSTKAGVVASDSLAKNFQHCIDLVRRRDYDQYLASFMLKKEDRSAVLALRAFNVETSSIQDVARDFNMAKLRMMWWRDTITRMYRYEKVDHPIAAAVQTVVHHFGLSKGWMNRIIDARESALVSNSFDSLEALEVYSEATASSVLYMTLKIVGVEDVNADHAASHIGKAMGICYAIRSIVPLARSGKVSLPSSLVEGCKVDMNRVLALESDPRIADAVFEMASLAKAHVDHARKLGDSVPKASVPVLQSAVPLVRYLDSLQAVDFEVFHEAMTSKKSHLPLQLSLLYHRIRGSF